MEERGREVNPDADSLYATVRAEIMGEWMDMPETYDEAGKGFQRGYNTALEVAAEKARGAIAVADVDVVRDFEAKITPHILRNWDRSRIVGFAKHLLGDECQECQKHNNTPHRSGGAGENHE
jgi:hypothetical protein